MTLLEIVGLIAIGTLLGSWIERIVSFTKLRSELSGKIDHIDGRPRNIEG